MIPLLHIAIILGVAVLVLWAWHADQEREDAEHLGALRREIEAAAQRGREN